MFVCPIRLRPLEGWRTPGGPAYPLYQGIPILTPAPEAVLATALAAAEAEDAAPDVISPFLMPAQLPAPPALSRWLAGLSETPATLCATWGHALAPPGPVADLRCGLGELVLRMAAPGRLVYALDGLPQQVCLARDLLLGAVREGIGPDGLRQPVPILPLRPAQVRFAIAVPGHPPLERGRLAWVHLAAAQPEEVEAAAALLAPGGVLTLTLPPELDEVAVSAALSGLEQAACQDGVLQITPAGRGRWAVQALQCRAMRRPMGAGTL